MNTNTEHFLHARSLRADVLAAPTVWLPRRDVLLDWLNGFLRRAEKATYDLAETEAADLLALDRYLRFAHVPVAQTVR